MRRNVGRREMGRRHVRGRVLRFANAPRLRQFFEDEAVRGRPCPVHRLEYRPEKYASRNVLKAGIRPGW